MMATMTIQLYIPVWSNSVACVGECLGCEEWFHLQCTSIPPKKHNNLKQVRFYATSVTLKTLFHSVHGRHLHMLYEQHSLHLQSFALQSPFYITRL